MAKFRLVHTSFWSDARVVEEMTAEDKYFFLYLLTNENATQIGIYQITKRQMAFDLGYSLDAVNALIQRFVDHHKIIKYNPETRELAIKNWGKYNLVKGGKPILDCVRSELQNVKDISLIPFVSEKIANPKIREVYDSYYESLTISSRNVDDTSTTRQENERTSNINGSYDTYHDTSTIRGQEKEEQEEKEKEKEEEQQQEEKSSLSPSLIDRDLLAIKKHYEEHVIYQPITYNDMEKLNQMLYDYEDYSLIIEAMKEAVERGRPKIHYIEGILKNWRQDGITNYQQYQGVQHAKSQRSNANGQIQTNHGRNETEIPADIDERLRNYTSSI